MTLAGLAAARLGRGEPEVTVVIPVFNKWLVTRRCLRALLGCDPDIALQVVVVDDGSTDETPAKLSAIAGVEVVRNGENCGFVRSCNRGAALARGRYLLFLNNDTEVAYGALRALVRRIERSERIGIVGSKLVYPDGRLQEAGNIVWTDATGWNYGRLDDPSKSEYNFARDVDYVSAASLLIRTTEFAAVGGFDERFAPGYYEDADLCFTIRARGAQIVYEPASVVVHHEGLTAGTDLSLGMKRFQSINQKKFIAKWETTLQRDHLASHPDNVYRAARLRHRDEPSLLVIDSYVPLYDREAGSLRLKRLVDGLRDAGVRIVFLPDNLTKMAPYAQQLQADGVEVIYTLDDHRRSWRDLLVEALPTVDAAWICRPDLCSKYLPTIREHATIPIVYDTIDLHHLRLRRQAESAGNVDDRTWRTVERLELACANASDCTVVVSDYEAELLAAAGVADVAIVPTVHDVELRRTSGYAKTAGILFIGGYNHVPNVDAATWLVREIMPLVWAQLPDVIVTLLGSNPPQSIRELSGDRAIVPGFVSDQEVAEAFRRARVFAAPLRFGAGIKGKIGQALGFGTPIVSTPVGIEGFHLTDETNVLVAGDAHAFAAAIVRLYDDVALWEQLSAASAAALEPFGSLRVVADALTIVNAAFVQSKRRSGRIRPVLAGLASNGLGVTNVARPLDTDSSSELYRLRAELRALRRREADLYLRYREFVEEARDSRERLLQATLAAAESVQNAEPLAHEVPERDAAHEADPAYDALLAIVATLRRALAASIERNAATQPRFGLLRRRRANGPRIDESGLTEMQRSGAITRGRGDGKDW